MASRMGLCSFVHGLDNNWRFSWLSMVFVFSSALAKMGSHYWLSMAPQKLDYCENYISKEEVNSASPSSITKVECLRYALKGKKPAQHSPAARDLRRAPRSRYARRGERPDGQG